ncbi:MAG: ion transporter [Euryarchaeota archaeon]|jgi:voltage-gated potassium channel|nr:ion transporter [Euryarchaeota archaeon]|tara:strand:- start:3218 stop:4042 length:825 start_codon:yes stop_codon:yes gene_type:complete
MKVDTIDQNTSTDWRDKIHEIIFEADTKFGKYFDIALLISILSSVIAVSLESVASIDAKYHSELVWIEWFFTILFSIEYILRIISVRKPSRYMTSFFGIVDLLAVAPTYLSLIFPGAQSLLVIRALRLLRIFRVFKLARYIGEAAVLQKAFMQSKTRIIVFLSTVFVLSAISGAGMYMVEGPESGFTSIPQSVYWAIVTLTSTGYGDIVPITTLGKIIAVFIMIMGYSLIIVPTGIMTTELVRIGPVSTQACISCSKEGHDTDAKYCKFCGAEL